MDINISQGLGRVPVTIMGLQGDLDASNYTELIDKTKELCDTGMKYLLLDLTNVPYMSSAGLVALHNIVLLMRADRPTDSESGRSGLHAMADEEKLLQKNIKLLNPQPKVCRTLEISGMVEFFEIYTDLESAVASF
jgi:anti-anti-sigma regulatory factor